MISVLNRSTDFFSQFLFTMNHYIYCKKHKIDFTLDTENWTFSYEKGWTDYFEPIDLTFQDKNKNHNYSTRYGHGYIIEDVPFQEYTDIIPEMYRYNEFMKKEIEKKKKELNLETDKYASIFIRRGNKLLCESEYIPTKKYIECLLKKDPDCQKIFLQTDDYNCYNDIQSYLNETNQEYIRVITLCPETLFGLSDQGFYNTQSNIEENPPYIEKIRSMDVQNKLVFDLYQRRFESVTKRGTQLKTVTCNVDEDSSAERIKFFNGINKEEMLDHMIRFLVGIDLLYQSSICVTDYSSNVAKFLKLWKGDKVIDVLNTEYELNKVKCPTY